MPVALELLACAAVLAGDVSSAEGALTEALTIAQAADTSRSEATVLAKRGLCHFLRGRFPEALDDFAASESLHALRGATSMAGTSAADRAVAYAAVGQLDEARAASRRARDLLGAPPDTHWTGRMLTLLEAATDAFAASAGGAPIDAVRADALAIRGAVLAHMPCDAQDLATRLSCLMLDRVIDHLA